MKASEFGNIIGALIIMTAASSLYFAIKQDWSYIPIIFVFCAVILFVNITAKKLMAYMVDADVEHEIWKMDRFGWASWMHLPKPILMGIIAPLFLTVISLGKIKFLACLTYEARALSHRAARRFGFFSYAGLTDTHNGFIGAAGIFAVLILALVAYILPFQLQFLAQLSSYFAFANMLPISNLDGTQIVFGSKILYFTLGIITLVFTVYSFLISLGAM